MSLNVKRFATLLITAMLALGLSACKEKAQVTHSNTEVKDKLFGDKEVTETEVIQKGDQVQVREKKTEIDDDGHVEQQQTTVKGDKID